MLYGAALLFFLAFFTFHLGECQRAKTIPSCELQNYAYFPLTEKCYKIYGASEESKKRVSVGTAQHYCSVDGGNLASIHSKAESEFIEDLLLHSPFITEHSYRMLIIGLSPRYDGNIEWMDNTPMNYTNWAENEPKKSDDLCTALEVFKNKTKESKWITVSCNKETRGDSFVCKVPRQKIFRENDCPAGYSHFDVTGKCYFTHSITSKISLPRLKEICGKKGGELVSIHSMQENNYLADLAKQHNKQAKIAFIGLVPTPFGETLRWLDSTHVDYQNLEKTVQVKPDRCVAVNLETHMWIPEKCEEEPANSNNLMVLCQAEPETILKSPKGGLSESAELKRAWKNAQLNINEMIVE